MESGVTEQDAPPEEGFGLRVAGFLIVVGGVLLAGFGAIGTWVSVGTIENVEELTQVYKGVDIWQGKVLLALGLVALLAVLITRMGATARIRVAAAGVCMATGLGILAIPVVTLLLGTQPYIDDEIANAEATGVPQRLLDALDRLLIASFGSGLWLALAGGIVVVVGATLTLVWASRYRSGIEPGDAGYDAQPS